MSEISHFDAGGDRRLAYRLREGRGPTIVFLPGYASDMEGGKAVALDAWAEAQGRAMLRFDYGGCGASSGDFEAQSLADWRNDVLLMIDAFTEGPVVLVGSSMGGWLMLLAALSWPERVAGLVGVAPAPDFTNWGFTQDQKMTILREGRLEQPNPYREQPTVTTRAFWESGEALRLLHAEIEISCPVRILHGQADADVPWAWSLELMKKLRSADVQATFVKDGDHRLSRPGDISLLIATVNGLLEGL
ncbi:MAG: 2-hydroxymuconic semialdehyde hydrolase [uncultured Sphingosinicella sp.]|uniref:2-hydroxymuconic semialdehyde hydrolase n=1 Tax=uncultured Sphingosinicella sp. TaxID=478748 RepID=A0A6J4U7M8_9SPHN|nr:alpha/beta hydrolase [uncultured Sphingosinicella sp.]CAA9542572.1 MAG: 2-hydroxymuconic semialdehyde hydrolase [uncultured Sphingosinicella sp.]